MHGIMFWIGLGNRKEIEGKTGTASACLYNLSYIFLLIISVLFFQSSEQESKGLPSKKGIVQSIVGQGYHRKIVLASQSVQNVVYK